jgi:hypothetical protein
MGLPTKTVETERGHAASVPPHLGRAHKQEKGRSDPDDCRRLRGSTPRWRRGLTIRGRLAPAADAGRREEADLARTGWQPTDAGSVRITRSARCDFCGSAGLRGERHRFVWGSPVATELVLAELCNHCASHADGLLKLYGGHGRHAIRLVQEARSKQPTVPRHRVSGAIARGLLYLLIALAAFLIVTLISSAAP